MQSCYLAVPGSVEKVVIVEEGLGGTEPKFIPENPVVVTLVDGCYSFVASKDSLFDDLEVAQTEAERLRAEEAETKRKASLKMIEEKDRPTEEGTSIGEGDSESSLVFILDNAVPHNTIPIEVVDGPSIIDVEAESSSEVSSEDDEPEVSDTCDTVAPASRYAKPQDIVTNIQKVLGDDVLPVDEIHKRLAKAGLMPLTNKPTEYLRYIFSKNRDIFDRPERGVFCLREGNPYRVPLGQPKPVEVVEEPVLEEEELPAVDAVQEEAPVKAKKGGKKKAKKKSKVKAKPKKQAEAKQELPLNTIKRTAKAKTQGADYSTWLGETMVQTNAFGSRFSGSSLRLLEQKRDNLWVSEITVVELGLFLSGTSKRRDFARKEAQKKMEAAINLLNIIKSKAINR